MNEFHKSRKKIILVSCTILYVGLMIATALFDSMGDTVMVSLWGSRLPLSSFNGVLNAGMAMLSIVMVCTDYRRGLRRSLFLMGCSILFMLRSIIVMKKLGALPGIANSLIMILALGILYRQLAQRETDIVTDFLTGLKNRRGLVRMLDKKINDKSPFYLFYVDLDDFKFVNDNYGHKSGDQLLCMIAQRMMQFCKKGAVISRLGGDEFVLLIPEQEDIGGVAQQIIDCIGEKIVIPGSEQNVECYVTASVGIVKYPTDSKEAGVLLKYADIAMYQAKKNGKNKYLQFNKDMEREIQRHAELETLMKESLNKNRFSLVYQPQYNLNDCSLRGFEALLRLKTEDGVMVSPGEMIPVAEETDLILKLDEYVLEHAMREFRQAVDMGKKQVLSINISAKSICRYGFATLLRQLLEKTGFLPEYLEIEITEYCIVQSLENARENIRELKALGIGILLDDFGTGFASLSYLTRLSVDILKVDKSFVEGIEADKKSGDFVNAMISIGHLQGCKVIAEGVENQMQVEMLRIYGCDYIQGFFWGKPMPFAEAAALPAVHE